MTTNEEVVLPATALHDRIVKVLGFLGYTFTPSRSLPGCITAVARRGDEEFAHLIPNHHDRGVWVYASGGNLRYFISAEGQLNIGVEIANLTLQALEEEAAGR